MSQRVTSVIVVVLVGLLLAGCSGALPKLTLSTSVSSEQAPDAARAPTSLTILHTNDNWGQTEPCG